MINELKNFLGPDLAVVYADGEKLLNSNLENYSDYSFMVFPYALVYEGFLKKLFLKLGAINEYQYNSDHWRVGKALNPNLEKELRHESVFDHLDPTLGNTLWTAWKNGRNKVFHYFPGKHKPLSFEEAKDTINQLNHAMTEALKVC